jgi:hypothetical protein
MAPTPGKPKVPLQYLLWDGTDPVDSFALGTNLEKRFRWQNLLIDSPAAEEFVVSGPPRVFQPDSNSKPPRQTDPAFPNLYIRGLFEFPKEFFDPVHHNVGDDRPNLLAYSGHGVPGFMFGEREVLICSSRAMTGSGDVRAGTYNWNFDVRPVRPKDPLPKWNNPAIKVALFSACRQLQGKPQQFFWSQAMRGANPVHMILSYRETAPVASDSASINKLFLKNLFGTNGKNGQKILDAWKNAHVGGSLPGRWAALCCKSAQQERLDDWTRTGKLPSSPAANEDILYFDSSTPSGRVVTQPHQDLDCFLTKRGDSKPFPPWAFFFPGNRLDLHIQFVDPSQSFQDFDEVWIAAIQVRPDFGATFDITQLFTFDVIPPVADPLSNGTVGVDLLVHNLALGNASAYTSDTYILSVKRNQMSFLTFDSTFNEMTIPIALGTRINSEHGIFYFMIKVFNSNTPPTPLINVPPRDFGIPTTGSGSSLRVDQARLIDDFQFAMFLLGGNPSP